jgi:adenylate cyclase
MNQNMIYQDYIQNIKDIMRNTELQKGFSIGSSPLAESRERMKTPFKTEYDKISKLEPEVSLKGLADLLNIPYIKQPYLGDHPDFKHLRFENGFSSDYHYIVSMFIDVKNSTNFHKKYSLEQISLIIQTITLAATHTCALFGGHIQRLQYDGVFTYFGGRNITKENAVKSAINAASFFNYFMKYELVEIFAIEGIERIYTRIGIDFGDDHEVQWVIFGRNQCTELTTNSLHTSLAPKMQANADPNGIVLGKNVKDRLGLADMYTDFIRDKLGNVDTNQKHIYKDEEKGFYYTQHRFEWEKFLLNTFPFIKRNDKGKIYIDYDYKENAFKKEQERIENLKRVTDSFENTNAFINTKGEINTANHGIIIPQNRFYLENE